MSGAQSSRMAISNEIDNTQLAAGPFPVPGGWVTRTVAVGSNTLRLTLPADPDAFLDDAGVQREFNRNGEMPYWPYLWSSAEKMAETLAGTEWPSGTEILEIGAGLGLVGLTAATLGFRVTASDYRREAVELLQHNAKQHKLDNLSARRIDWRSPPAEQFSIILGCDVIYERNDHRPILQFIQQVLSPGGECRLADPGRQHASHFVSLARDHGFKLRLSNNVGQQVDDLAVGEFRMIALSR